VGTAGVFCTPCAVHDLDGPPWPPVQNGWGLLQLGGALVFVVPYTFDFALYSSYPDQSSSPGVESCSTNCSGRMFFCCG
jgi:hypothetical protein